jgi:hypothetical protein
VAITEVAVSAPYLAPLIIRYRLHIVNPIPEEWVHPLLMMPPVRKWLLAVNAPGITALATILIMWRRAALERVSVVIFATWTAVCVLFCFAMPHALFLMAAAVSPAMR